MESRTDAILSQFANSWVETEIFYRDLIDKYNLGKVKPILQFIVEQKKKGGDKIFRIGTSIDVLFISRSVNNGLRIDQKFIRIDNSCDNKFFVVLRDGKKTYREYMLDELNDPRLIKLLKTLEDTLVD